jgi:hypothetical protein
LQFFAAVASGRKHTSHRIFWMAQVLCLLTMMTAKNLRPAPPTGFARTANRASERIEHRDTAVGGGTLNSMPPRTLHPGPEPFDIRPESREDAARAALDSRAGRTPTSAEWLVARAKLLEFVTILRGLGSQEQERRAGIW